MRNYTKIKSYVEERYLEQQERKIDVGTKKDKALGSFDDGEEAWLDDENSLNACKGGKKGCGKGKGTEGKGGQCYRCSGHGHHAREGPNPRRKHRRAYMNAVRRQGSLCPGPLPGR